MENSEYDNGWGVLRLSGGGVHVATPFDIVEHVLDANCPCCPKEKGEAED